VTELPQLLTRWSKLRQKGLLEPLMCSEEKLYTFDWHLMGTGVDVWQTCKRLYPDALLVMVEEAEALTRKGPGRESVMITADRMAG
jgi:hypothetical protein